MKNKRGEVAYPAKYWDKISPEAKDLVGKMLNRDPRTRIQAKEALAHPWFRIDNKSGENLLADVQRDIGNLD